MKTVTKFVLANSLIAILAISSFAGFSVYRLHEEEDKDASENLERCMLTSWELLREKGEGFRIVDNKILAGNYVINGNFEVPDRVQKIFGGVATVFMGDARVSTNVLKADGSRAIGTRLEGPAYDAIFKEEKSYRGEAPILGIPYLTAYDPIRDGKGNIVGVNFVGVKREVLLAHHGALKTQLILTLFVLMAIFTIFMTLLAKMAGKLEKTKESHLAFLQTLIDTIPTPVFYKNTEGKYLGGNKAFEEMTGLSRESLTSKTVLDINPSHLAEIHHNADLELLRKQGVKVYESAVAFADGALHDVICFKATFPAPDGTLGGIVGTLLDISDRKRMESALAKEKEFAESLVLNSTVPTFVLDSSHRVISWNRACEELTGVKSAELLGTDEHWKALYDHKRPLLADFAIDGNLQNILDYYSSFSRSDIIPEGLQAEGWFSGINGRDRFLCSCSAPIRDNSGELVASIETLQDITAHKRADELLHVRESQQKALLNNIPDIAWVKNAENCFLAVNEPFARACGRRQEELSGLTDLDVWPNDLALRYIEDDLEVMISRLSKRVEEPLMDAEGRRIWIETVKSPMFDAEGRVTGTVGIARDITERKRAQEALARSEAEFRRLSMEFHGLLDAIPDNIRLLDRDLKILWVNKAAVETIGLTAEAIVGQFCYALLYQRTTPCDPCPAMQSFSTGEPRFETSTRPDGRIWDNRTVPLIDEQGEIVNVIAVNRDITEQRKLEAQLRQSQKIESVGTLAGGIAHDFNNILTTIIGYGQITLMKMAADDPLRQNINCMLEGSDRAARLTQQLLLFSRKTESDRKPVDLNEVVAKVEKFLKKVISEDITYKTAIHEAPIPVFADEHQLEQVLMNLATNAGHAMPQGGALTVTTEIVTLDERFVSAHGFGKPGPYALLTVEDNGMGMDEATRQRIFEPFFTTKEVGKGTGLGLAITYGIIKQHDGYINAYSEPGIGTTFKIYLPVIAAGRGEERLAEQEEVVVGGTETILLAEDDEMVRRLVVSVLTEYGYKVIEAVDGADAVSRFNENKDRIDLLLSDLIMPKMNGKEALDEIRKVRPGIKAIFSSGYAPDTIREKVSLADGVHLIAKPVSPNELLRKVRRVLDEEQ